eukprot:519634_1
MASDMSHSAPAPAAPIDRDNSVALHKCDELGKPNNGTSIAADTSKVCIPGTTMGTYIRTESALNAIRNYKYSGEDNSICFCYVLTPMNKVLINFFPLWMAPNVITLLGCLCMVAAFCLTSYLSPRFDQEIPPWACYFVAAMMFWAQTLDNLDGRQARRTNSSSALGMMFDHGVDSIQVSFILLCGISIIGGGTTWIAFFLWPASVFCGFFMATWEHYETGSLVLGKINAPSEGNLLVMLLSVVRGMRLINPGESLQEMFPFIRSVGI